MCGLLQFTCTFAHITFGFTRNIFETAWNQSDPAMEYWHGVTLVTRLTFGTTGFSQGRVSSKNIWKWRVCRVTTAGSGGHFPFMRKVFSSSRKSESVLSRFCFSSIMKRSRLFLNDVCDLEIFWFWFSKIYSF